MTVNRKPTADLVREVLACPVCHDGLVLRSDQITCRACTFQGSVSEDVVLLAERTAASFFDARFGVMQQGHAMGNGEWQLCYEQQLQYLEPYLGPGKRVLDVGCGPAIPYKRDPDCFLIGLEASYPSVRANRAVDLRLYGTAAALPLAAGSVDAILCLYSIHHMIGASVRETTSLVSRALQEFGRVLGPGGDLFVCEVNPWWPAWLAQRALWDQARALLRSKLDQFFWPTGFFASKGREWFPRAELTVVRAKASPLATFPPVFSLPWLRVPRFLYPFHACLFHWHFPAGRPVPLHQAPHARALGGSFSGTPTPRAGGGEPG